MGAGSLNKIPSRTLPFTDSNGLIHPIWYEYLRVFIKDTIETGSSSTGTGTVSAGAGLTGGGFVSDGVSLAVGEGNGIKVNANDIEVDINGQINSNAAVEDEIMIVDASETSSIRKTTLQSVVDLVDIPAATETTPGGSNTEVQYNSSGAFAGDSNFTTDGSGNVSVGGSLDISSSYISLGGSSSASAYCYTNNGGTPTIYGPSTAYKLETQNDGFILAAGSGKQFNVKDDSTFAITGLYTQRSVESGITASTTQSQGEQPLTKDINEISTVANTDDVVTLAAAAIGRYQLVINNGANQLQIFPSTGVDLGAGTNTSTTLAAGSSALFVAWDASNYAQLI